MPSNRFGKTLVIANPSAQKGEGESAALFATQFFSSLSSSASSCEIRLIETGHDARNMASDAHEYDTVIALGGDGVIHEVVNGMMSIPAETRPRLGIVSIGTGNDFARTLGLPCNDPKRALTELVQGEERCIDLGKVNDEYFIQTLSFGLDAAISHETNDRCERRSKKTGDILFVTSGIRILLTGLRGWPYQANVDGKTVTGSDLAFAVQNGPTYGGGFQICPKAKPDDGMLDLCFTTRKISVAHSLFLFGLVRFGWHTRSKRMNMCKVKHLEVEFTESEQPPCQADGERLHEERYVIDVVPAALNTIVSRNCSW